MDIIRDAERCIGSRGLLPPEPAERIIRDLRLYLRQPCFDAALAAAGAFSLTATEDLFVHHESECTEDAGF